MAGAAVRLALQENEADPVWAAFERAPLAKEPETPEQRQLAEEALRGPFRKGHVVSEELAARCRSGS